jgi:hypothetical protein
MQRLKGRSVLFGALAVLACSGDPTGNESTPTEIQANPEVVFVTQGDSQPVVVQVLDEDGQVLQADFTATNVGNGITVRLDPTYQRVTTGNPIRRGTRFFVSGVDLTSTSFKVNALGLTKTIEVTSVPGELDAEITDSLPALGDTISITAPTGTFFTDSSVVTFNGAAPVVVSQDETTITFIPLPNTDGPALVSHVGVESNSSVVFDLTTPFRVKTDSITDIGTAISDPTPALGDPITLTLPAGLKLLPESLVTLNIAGNAVLPRNRTLSADSTVITFVPPPNADSFVVVNGVVPARLAVCCGATPGYPLLLATTAPVTTPVVDSFPAVVNDAAPNPNDVVTLTSSDAAFTIDPAATAAVGAAEGLVTARTANSISFTAAPGSTGPITVTGVIIAGFPLTLTATAGDVTFGTTITPLTGTDAPGTAPTLTFPETPGSYLLTDVGSFDYPAPIFGGAFGTFPSRLYKVTVPADADVTVTLDWVGGAEDLGAYWFAADGTTEPGYDPADAGGEGAHPETATNTVAAGTYTLAIVNFSATNPQFSIRLDVAPPSAP